MALPLKAIYSPYEICHLTIIVNLDNDFTAILHNQVIYFNFRTLNIFSFGQHQYLIGSLDLLYRNSWNKMYTLNFTGEQIVLQALKTILGKMHYNASVSGYTRAVLL